MAVARNLSLRLGACLREAIDGSPKTHRFLKVVDNIGTESMDGFCEEEVRNLRCGRARAVGLVVTEPLISPVRYC